VERPVCAAFVGMTLDGFIARPDGRLDFLDPFAAEPHGYEGFFAGVDTVLVGRATWEFVAGLADWPYPGKRVAVLTHRPLPARRGEIVLAGPPAEALDRLGREGAHRVYADGGSVVSQFLAAGLLDELTVSVVPVVLGQGIRLFQPPLSEQRLRFGGSEVYRSGLVQLRYRPRETPKVQAPDSHGH